MKNLLFLFCLFTFLLACKSDRDLQDEFSGKYEVSIEAPNAEKDLKKAKKDMKKDLENAREDIEDGIEDAKEDIKKEFGNDSNIGNAISNFVEGMGHLAESMTNLGESLGEMGIDLGTDVISNVNFQAEFQRDGELIFGKSRGIRVSGNEKRWKFENNKIYIWEDGDEERNAEEYKIKNISETEIDLIGDNVIFHLIKQ